MNNLSNHIQWDPEKENRLYLAVDAVILRHKKDKLQVLPPYGNSKNSLKSFLKKPLNLFIGV